MRRLALSSHKRRNVSTPTGVLASTQIRYLRADEASVHRKIVVAIPNRIVVEVTQEHINAGKHRYNSCPIALALAAEGHRASVYEKGLIVDGFGFNHSIRSARFVRAFDDLRPVSPARFIITRCTTCIDHVNEHILLDD